MIDDLEAVLRQLSFEQQLLESVNDVFCARAQFGAYLTRPSLDDAGVQSGHLVSQARLTIGKGLPQQLRV